MYAQHFGFTKEPFKIPPDPEFFFPGGNRGAVLEALVYAVSRGEGIVKVVGEVGSGKTMLCRMLERELPQRCEIVYLANPRLSADEILHAIAFELGFSVVPTASKLQVMQDLHDYLLARHAEQRRVVVFIEEAQGMPIETLEEIRMLSNLETTQDKLLQIVLFGQPELNDKLGAHEIRQLQERISYRFELAPFGFNEVCDYVNARARASGFRGNELFSAAACRALTRYSKGLLRRINILADKALLAAYSCGDRLVLPRHVRMAARDSEISSAFARRPLVAGVAMLLVAAVAGVGLWWLTNDLQPAAARATAGASLGAPGLTDAPHPPPGPPVEPSQRIEDFFDDIDRLPIVSQMIGEKAGDSLTPMTGLDAAYVDVGFITLDTREPETIAVLTVGSLNRLPK